MIRISISHSLGIAYLMCGVALLAACAKDIVVHEESTAGQSAEVIASGAFVDADLLHKGRGTATLSTNALGGHLLRLTDFEVSAGPALEIWLVENPDVASTSDVSNSKWVSLGPLKGNIGDQNYDVPAEIDVAKYGSVVIWCTKVGVLFSPAKLKSS